MVFQLSRLTSPRRQFSFFCTTFFKSMTYSRAIPEANLHFAYVHQSPILNRLFIAHLTTDADMEDYGFEYSEEEPEEQDVDIENQYYNSKGMFMPGL
ncbi:hypothetical protein L1987_16898 [Smallanthus sonchifolius]|uniref:Uncharacterized protein n=1 Tax=Smallanthus sonchifolius TaxID=185202 RepID=A0ACB9IXL8_9ASTR|nr:hypothetical protein L1987_16898 [Smallanthus sonchifolius]